MNAFKLVVVSAFNDYRRGSEICDQVIVKKILNRDDPMHHFEQNCRRVVMTPIEQQQYIIPEPQNEAPESDDHELNNDQLNINSINDEAVSARKSRRK